MDQPIRSTNRIIEYRLNGRLHRTDGPARIFPDGSEYWYQNSKTHRDNGPAVIRPDGYQEWFQNGYLHRTDGPARIWADREEEFWLDGEKVDVIVHFLQRT